MAKADLHLHSKYSDYPSTWILKAYNSPESFTETETIYQQAKSRGMDFVTITDHDDIRGSLELVKNHPLDTFVSCEVTSYFPEDNVKVHILVYGITQEQFSMIMKIRRDLYKLRNYIARNNIAYSVAHATYDQDGKLSFDHIEKLVLLFDVFEIINGGASERANSLLKSYLSALTDHTLDELQAKHKITPISKEPWIKSFTGGSDDHSGILIGTAYTESAAQTVEEFLSSLRHKKTQAFGLSGSFESYATGVVKHIHDYRSNRDGKYKRTKMSDFLQLFFVGEEGNIVKRFRKSHSLRLLKQKNNKIHKALHKVLEEMTDKSEQEIANKIPRVYDQVANLHDQMFRSVVLALTKKLPQGDIFKVFQHLSSLFPMTLLASPFVGSLRHQVLKSNIRKKLIEGSNKVYAEKALWFTDTITDLNGVSVTLRQIAEQSQSLGYRLKLVTCVDLASNTTRLPNNTINLDPIYEAPAPGYEHQIIRFPSLLTMMKKVSKEQPDQIIISTPGPVGLGALLCAKLLDLPVKAVYHTDFAQQILMNTGETALANMVNRTVNLFYKQFDKVYVPSQSYIHKLIDGGLRPETLEIFPRGIDLSVYRQSDSSTDQKSALLRRHQLHGKFTLIYAGRVSQDKNLDLLVEIAALANLKKPGLFNLVIAGDGPYLTTLKEKFTLQSQVLFTGRLNSKELVNWYQSSDLMVFPSHTDTFGMVILEAQACGLPCIVTGSGGPKEIIDPDKTGTIVRTDNARDWVASIKRYYRLKNLKPQAFQQLQKTCSQRVHEQNSWDEIFKNVLGAECKTDNETHNVIHLESITESTSLEQIA